MDGATHEYILIGSQILCEIVRYGSTENYRLIYVYDESGALLGVKYRRPNMAQGEFICFFFEKNLQGDIVAVYYESGNKRQTNPNEN